MGYVEKPMLSINGVRLIDMAVNEVERAGLEAIFVTSRFTEKTERYLMDRGFEVFRGDGTGYMRDVQKALAEYGLTHPVLTLNSDLYYVVGGIVDRVLSHYFAVDTPALTTVYPNGRHVGINVFDPIFGEQEEEKIILDESTVINIDTPADVERALWMSTLKREKDW
ncbi:NTP transferase domain-containing protein [Geoglobus acetivorans]